jgi:metal-sulfur cluster biosynthetic enzyme
VSAPARILDALCEVYDPCSQAWSRPISVVDLGLVRGVWLDATGQATVRISLTAPFCMAVATIMQAVERRVGAVPGVRRVHVDIDTETPWQPDLMTEYGRQALHRRRTDDATRAAGSPSGRST